MPKFVPTKKAKPAPTPAARSDIPPWMVEAEKHPVVCDDAGIAHLFTALTVSDIVSGKYQRTQPLRWSFLPVKTAAGYRYRVELSSVGVKSKELADRQRDAKVFGTKPPIAITEWGESIFGFDQHGQPIKSVAGLAAVKLPATSGGPPAPAPTPANRASVPAPVVFKPKPGVVAKIVEIVGAATKKRPATVAGIVAVLAKEFPDRDPEKMKRTVTSQLHGAMKAEKGIDVSRDGAGGYWISK